MLTFRWQVTPYPFTRTRYWEKDYTCELDLAVQVLDLRGQTQTEKVEAGETMSLNLEDHAKEQLINVRHTQYQTLGRLLSNMELPTWGHEYNKQLWACSSYHRYLWSLDGRSGGEEINSMLKFKITNMLKKTFLSGYLFTDGIPTSTIALRQKLMLSVWRNCSPFA